jgi:hypothetical protein
VVDVYDLESMESVEEELFADCSFPYSEEVTLD